MKNRVHTMTFALGLGALGLGTLTLPDQAMAQQAMTQQAMTQPQVQTKLTAQGYTKVHDLKFDDGMWKADARSANGNRVKVHIDAKTGQIYPERPGLHAQRTRCSRLAFNPGLHAGARRGFR